MTSLHLIVPRVSAFAVALFPNFRRSAAWSYIFFMFTLPQSVTASPWPPEQREFNDDEPMATVVVPAESTGKYDVPTRARIRSIEAEMYNVTTILSARLPDVDSFVVPASSWDAILEYFRNPRVDPAPRVTWPAIGRLKITQDDGEVIDITFFWYKSKTRLHYSVRGVRCYDGRGGTDRGAYDDALTLDQRLRTAYKCLKGHITTEPLRSEKCK